MALNCCIINLMNYNNRISPQFSQKHAGMWIDYAKLPHVWMKIFSAIGCTISSMFVETTYEIPQFHPHLFKFLQISHEIRSSFYCNGGTAELSPHSCRIISFILISGYCLLKVYMFYQHSWSFLLILQFPLISQNPDCRSFGYFKLPCGVNVCVRVNVYGCEHCALQYTGIPSRVYFHLVLSVPGISSGSTVILTRIERLLNIISNKNVIRTSEMFLNKNQDVQFLFFVCFFVINLVILPWFQTLNEREGNI